MKTLVMLAALLAQSADDHPRAVAGRIQFPSADDVKSWTDKGPEYATVLKAVLAKETWGAAVKFLEENLAPFSDDWTIAVSLGEWEGDHPAHGERDGKAAVIKFNMKKLGAYERKMIDFRKQDEDLRKNGKRIEWKVPPLKYDRLIPHELVHVLQGGFASPDWFHEGLASWAGDDMNYVKAFLYKAESVQDVEAKLGTDDDVYGRGQIFMKWLEQKLGRAAFKTLAKSTFIDGGAVKPALEKLLKIDWDRIKADELAWAKTYSTQQKPK
jgi:hypothetical protein